MADKRWSPTWDLSTIPDDLILSEAGKRYNARRVRRSGGSAWSVHLHGYSRCRCPKCTERREARKAS